MRKFAFATLVLFSIFGTSNEARAQYSMNADPMQQMDQLMRSMGDPMADLQRLTNDLNRRQAAMAQQQVKLQRKVIDDYRKWKNDYTSSDQVILQRSMAEARQRNPQLFRASDARHRMRMADLNSQFQSGQKINRMNQEILDMGMRGYQNRAASSDRMQHQSVNAVWGRSDFFDSNTGQTHNLDTNHTNVWQWDNENTFYGDQTGTQWRHSGNGFWDELEEIK